MSRRHPAPLEAEQFARLRADLEPVAICLNPACRGRVEGGRAGGAAGAPPPCDDAPMVRWTEGQGRPPRFCSDACRMQFNYMKARFIAAWERVEWSKGQAVPPAPKRELDKAMAQIEWHLLRYGVADVRSVAVLPEEPSIPLRIHMMGPTDEPEDWASAMSEVIEAVKFYEGRQLPERVRRALSAARTGAELSPYFEWLSQEGRVDPQGRSDDDADRIGKD